MRAPPELRHLQRRFAAGLVDRRADAISANIVARGARAADRFDVYSNNFYVSLTDALAAVYPVIARLLGEACFRQTARRYVAAHPSPSGDLHDFGAEFGQHLDSIAEFSAWPYLADVARLEWAWHRAFHAADGDGGLPLESLAGLDPQALAQVRFRLHPSAQLLRSRWPLRRIWEAQRDASREPDLVSLDEGGADLLLLRVRLEIELLPLAPGELEFLQALAADAALGDALDVALAAASTFDLSSALARHVHNGALMAWSLIPFPPSSTESLHVR